MAQPRDPSTGSNYEQVSTKNYKLTWDVDFDKKKIIGNVEIELEVHQLTNHVILDIQGLKIEKIRLNGSHVSDAKTEDNGALGQKLIVPSPTQLTPGSQITLTIDYATGDNAAALQFLTADQTTDKKAPYLFSQCQAIHARSIVPSMDTPSVKSTYTATVTVPATLTCLMSAIGGGSEKLPDGRNKFTFNQPVPIPSYLLAIVVGNLEQKTISDRCSVWAEPSVADAAHYEFAETEKILKVAEEVAGPYVWGRYDLVVLPATFPFGGMENPCLTFVTPTLLAGDRSLVNVIAHEIAHSWTGNLVTNCSWEHFWLNEGFTVFLERKIHGRMNGELERQFESERGFDEALVPTVNKVFGCCHEFTKLIQNLTGGVDPDDAFSSVPYEKGSALLFTLEQLINNRTRFEDFLRSYIQKHAYKTVFTEVWKNDLYQFFADKKGVLDTVDWDLWLREPGVPPRPNYDSTLMEKCKAIAAKWTDAPTPPTDGAEFLGLANSQKVSIVDSIRASGKMKADRVEQMTTLYKLNEAKNAELRFSWLMVGLETKWEPIIEPSLAFALAIGRMKFCKPIYRALFGWSLSKERAVSQFKTNVKNMHPITVKAIEKFL